METGDELIRRSHARAIGRWAFLAAMLSLLTGCGPPYLAETSATSTPRPTSLDVGGLARTPVAVLAFVAPGSLQGFGPNLSFALSGALAEVDPPIREIRTDEVVNRLTDQGLTTQYADLRAGFARDGILNHQQLRRIGSGLASHYVLLPGVAQFDETIIDKFEAGGIKLLRNRVTVLRLWLQLWDAQTGHIVWESSGEVTVASVFFSPKRTVALEQIAKRLLVRMIQDGLLESKTETQVISDQ